MVGKRWKVTRPRVIGSLSTCVEQLLPLLLNPTQQNVQKKITSGFPHYLKNNETQTSGFEI